MDSDSKQLFFFFINLITFLLFLLDKILSKCNEYSNKMTNNKNKYKNKFYRLPEKTLLGFLFLGPFGGVLGMILCCHKTRKCKFWGQSILFLIIHAYGIVQYLYQINLVQNNLVFA